MDELKSIGAIYWETGYRSGRTSGVGSYGNPAKFKASVLNKFLAENKCTSVVEFGYGDGNQLSMIDYPQYTGYDISQAAVDHCKTKFKDRTDRQFYHIAEYDGRKADLAVSLDVIYHIIEDEVFDIYMRRLFAAATDYVIIYAVDRARQRTDCRPHIRYRKFSDWVLTNEPEFKLLQVVPNECGYATDFYIYRRL